MFLSFFRNLSIRTKLIIVTFFLVMIPLVCVAYLSMDRFGKALKSSSEDDLEHLVRNIYSMCKIQQEMVQIKVVSDLNVARQILYSHGDEIKVLHNKKLHFDAVDQFTSEGQPVTVPVWMVGGITLSRDTALVDEVQKLIGGTCTIFQKIDGNHLLRISTNVRGSDGRRAVGTFIPAYSPVAEAILAGHPYKGRAYVVDDWYITAYEPIRGGNGSVIGALYVGVREQSAYSLREEIKKIQVGDTGYVYIVDSNGNLKVHPAKEGQNIIDSRDSSGFEYIRSMVKNSMSLSEGDVGTIRYPWINPELGDTKPRQKINKYIYFAPWDWIIAAGTYEEEIYHSLYETEQFILIIGLAGLALVCILTITFSNVLTKPIHELTEVTTKMVGGDLSQRVKIHSADEIGILGVSFNRMVVQIQHQTTDLENMVEARTRELKESREKYRDISRFLNSILDSATEYAIIALDFYGKIIEFNKGAERLFGWKKDEVLNGGEAAITLLPEDRERGIQKEMSKRIRTEGVCELEMDRIRKNGQRFPALSTITAIKDPSGTITGYVEIVRDLTQRKTLEKELRETKEFLENIMESSVDGIVTTDLKGKITYLNRAIEDMLGYRRSELLEQHISCLYVTGIKQARDIMGLLQADERAENYEMKIKKKGGKILAIMTSLFLLRHEDGQVIGTAGIFKDITEQKRLEAKLKTAQVRMVEASKLRALGELVAGVAHELNNPLMAAQTILYVILKNPQKDCPNLERLKLIQKCNDRIEKIVEHLREFARQTSPEFQKININLPIENALMITGQQLLNHNISVVRNLSDDLPEILGDSNQLEQVFLNLISNARDAMDVAGNAKELTIKSYLVEDYGVRYAAVSIKDTGVGISEKNIDKVFEPFYTTKPVGKGTGLGLSLCFGIVEAHGGRLEIHSKHLKGTEVIVLIPIPAKET